MWPIARRWDAPRLQLNRTVRARELHLPQPDFMHHWQSVKRAALIYAISGFNQPQIAQVTLAPREVSGIGAADELSALEVDGTLARVEQVSKVFCSAPKGGSDSIAPLLCGKNGDGSIDECAIDRVQRPSCTNVRKTSGVAKEVKGAYEVCAKRRAGAAMVNLIKRAFALEKRAQALAERSKVVVRTGRRVRATRGKCSCVHGADSKKMWGEDRVLVKFSVHLI